MLQNKRNKRFTFLFFLLFLFSWQCANQLPPTGGDIDQIPPEIIEVYPHDGTINFDEDYFEIEFSEYVDKRSVNDAVFISPFIDGSLEYNWTGKSLEVVFPEDLKKDVTYTITIGTDVVDLNNKNRMAEAFTFSFSTGNKIDKKKIIGKVYGKEKEGIFIYAYKFGDSADSLLKNKPDYVSQTGVEGNYSLRGLGEGNYRVFAIEDQFRDYLYQQEQDKIGIPFKDIYLSEKDSIYVDLNFLIFNADITKPRLISGIMTDRNHLLVSCSKELDRKSIKANNFYLIDSTENREYKFSYAFKGKTKEEEFILIIDEDLNPSNLAYLFADTLSDNFGNLMINDFAKILISDRVDTNSIKIVSTEPAQSKTTDFQKTEIKIYFDEPFDKDLITSSVALTDTFNKPVDVKIDYYDDATLVVKPNKILKPETDYHLIIQLGKFIDVAGNFKDSLFTLKFKTISGLDFTGLSGYVINLDYNKNPVLILESGDIPDKKYEQKLTSEAFEFSRIEPGKYLLWCFLDEYNNGKYDYGWPEPIKYSERFSFYTDTLTLRPRWEVTDLSFKFK